MFDAFSSTVVADDVDVDDVEDLPNTFGNFNEILNILTIYVFYNTKLKENNENDGEYSHSGLIETWKVNKEQ